MALQSIENADLENKQVLVRFDFNVPLNDKQEIIDPTRIDLALPTLEYIINKGAKKIILLGHLGRPKSKVVPKLSFAPVASYIADKLKTEIILAESPYDNNLSRLISLPKTKIVMVENLRFWEGETTNHSDFCQLLAKLGEVYINDAFGCVHRKHSSVYGIIKHFPKTSYAGFLIQKEIDALTKIIESPSKPFYAVVGGAKISDKIKSIEALLPKVNKLFIGGAMAYPFLRSKGFNIGKSLCSDEDIKLASKLLSNPLREKIILPLDHITSPTLPFDKKFNKSEVKETQGQPINDNDIALDIGPKTIHFYCEQMKDASTIFWNGPMGLFEHTEFSQGTIEISKLVSQSQAFTLVGGGDSVSAVKKTGHYEMIDHISTGGGASLEFIEKGSLPGVQALKFGIN
jgi:phosphoglycerate kinase